MTDDTAWISIPEFADRIGVKPGRVRELLRERYVLAIRRGDNNALYLRADFLRLNENERIEILPTLRGTLVLLEDAGFTDDEMMAWLLEENEELGATPLAALLEGRRSPVRRIAQVLM